MAFAVLEMLNEAQQRARDAASADGTLLTRLSHELRTPLNAISGFAEILTDDELELDDVTQAQFLDGIMTASRTLAQLLTAVVEGSPASE